MKLVFHIVDVAEWLAARPAGRYVAASLADEGFIHCSTADQVVWVANQRFVGASDLVLLCIDVDSVDVEVRYEDCYETGREFPHIYGPLDLATVVAIVEFPPGPDGTFGLPPLLAVWPETPGLRP